MDVGVPSLSREACLRSCVPPAPEHAADRKAEPGSELVSLVEAAPPPTAPMQGNRNGQIRAAENRSALPPEHGAQRSRHRSPAVVLECVHDCAQRPVVVADRPACSDVRPSYLAQLAAVIRGDRSPCPQGIAADPAERRVQDSNPGPATVAHGGVQRILERPPACGARRRQHDGQQPVDRFSNHGARRSQNICQAPISRQDEGKSGRALTGGRLSTRFLRWFARESAAECDSR
jgi:hypothetical protein